MAEFDGIRAKMYKDALSEFPNARKSDLDLMKKYLSPQKGEIILEIGAGNGLFSSSLADLVSSSGKIIVLDPSREQLDGVKELGKNNIEIINSRAEELDLKEDMLDAVWSFGAVHHISDKTKAFEKFYYSLKSGGRLLIADVFAGSSLAKHFDEKVAKYCVTGHDVTFLTREFTENLCRLAGFKKPEFHDFNAHWQFDTKEEIGTFLYKLHAMTKTTPQECLNGAEEILGITKENDRYCLNWPMTMISTAK